MVTEKEDRTMRLKRILCIILTLIIAISSVGGSALALEGSDHSGDVLSNLGRR